MDDRRNADDMAHSEGCPEGLKDGQQPHAASRVVR
jgi:hypothetical protein